MIEFIQDYVTKALPPETFADGEQVSRSAESELYFVRLGVAGFVVDGTLVDQDYQPIVRKTVAIVVTTDRRFADTGRGGEVIGLDTPQRATSGPGNAVIVSGQPDNTTLGAVEVTQLRGDLAASVSRSDQQAADEGRIDQLNRDLMAVHTEKEAAAAAANEARADLAAAREDIRALTKRFDAVSADLTAARADGETSAARIVDLERSLAAAKPVAKTK